MPEFEINYLAVLVSAVAGFVIVMLNKVLWEGKPFKLYLLDAAHYFFSWWSYWKKMKI